MNKCARSYKCAEHKSGVRERGAYFYVPRTSFFLGALHDASRELYKMVERTHISTGPKRSKSRLLYPVTRKLPRIIQKKDLIFQKKSLFYFIEYNWKMLKSLFTIKTLFKKTNFPKKYYLFYTKYKNLGIASIFACYIYFKIGFFFDATQ